MIYLTVTVAYAFAVLAVYFWRQARAMRACLKQYAGGKVARLAPGMVEDCAGHKTTSTVCFTDIQGFSGICESLAPERVSFLLREIFPPALEAIRKAGGEVDKIIGDALLYRHEDAEAAVGMVEAVHMALEKSAGGIAGKLGCPRLGFTTGVHTGDVFTCQIGSKGGFVDFTTIGDAVNVSSRVQGLCKYYGVQALITGKTFNFAGKLEGYKRLDVIAVKGKEQPIEIYAKEPYPGKWLEFEAARALYANGEFAKARQAFVQAGDAFKMWTWRCEQLEKNPPEEWKGVWKWSQK